MATASQNSTPQSPVACAAGGSPEPRTPNTATPPKSAPDRRKPRRGTRRPNPASERGGRGPDKHRYGIIPPGSALVEADGRVNLANADMDWARFAPDGGSLVAIHALRRQVGLFALSDGSHRPPCTVPIHTHPFNTSLIIDRELNAIGVDLSRAPGTPGMTVITVGVVRVRRAGCGTRYLVLQFPPSAFKPRAQKHKHGGRHGEA